MVVSRAKVRTCLMAALYCTSVAYLMFVLKYTFWGNIIKERREIITTVGELQDTETTAQYIPQDVRVLTKLNISNVAEIFPIDSSPPITLHRGFIIENAGLCSSYLSLTYVVVVHSAPDHFEMRQSLRDTWAKGGVLKDVNSRTIFVLGKSRDKTVQASIEQENKAHRDIVQGDFYDHYRNLTLKAVMGLKWVAKNCPNAQYIIKVDDDVFVNIFQVHKTVFPILAANDKQVVCSAEPHPFVFRLDNPAKILDKWKVADKYFKNMDKYPMPFCYGYATFYTTSLAADLLKTAASTPFFRLDDVYVYGILVSKTKGATWRNEGGRYFNDEKRTAEFFLKKTNSLVGTVRSRSDMEKLWHAVEKQQQSELDRIL